jgi:hypothetical protein
MKHAQPCRAERVTNVHSKTSPDAYRRATLRLFIVGRRK